MTLQASPTSISIRNSSGQTKFTSADKLLYRKNYFSGGASLGGGTRQVQIGLPGAVTDANTLYIIQARIDSSNGNIGSGYLGSTFDLSSALLMHFSYSTTAVQITAEDVLSGCIRRSSSASDLHVLFSFFNVCSDDGTSQMVTTNSATSLSLTYFISFFGWK